MTSRHHFLKTNYISFVSSRNYQFGNIDPVDIPNGILRKSSLDDCNDDSDVVVIELLGRLASDVIMVDWDADDDDDDDDVVVTDVAVPIVVTDSNLLPGNSTE